MSGHDLLRELEVLVRSRYSLVVLETAEEERAATLLRELAHRMGLPLFTWSMTRGIRRDDGGSVPAPRGVAPSAPERDPFVPDPFSRSGRIPMAAFERRDEPAGTPYDTTHPVQALHHVELSGLAAVYHFSGLGAHLDEPLVAAKLRDAAASFREGSGAIVLTGAGTRLPESTRAIGTVLSLPLPTVAEYRKMLRETVE